MCSAWSMHCGRSTRSRSCTTRSTATKKFDNWDSILTIWVTRATLRSCRPTTWNTHISSPSCSVGRPSSSMVDESSSHTPISRGSSSVRRRELNLQPEHHRSHMLSDSSILITGGAGFIGSTLAARLVDHNRVTIFDNFKRDALSRTSLSDHPNISVVKGDILDERAVTDAAAGHSHVVHCAAIAGIDTVSRKPRHHDARQHGRFGQRARPPPNARPHASESCVSRQVRSSAAEPFDVAERRRGVHRCGRRTAVDLCGEQARRGAPCVRLLRRARTCR